MIGGCRALTSPLAVLAQRAWSEIHSFLCLKPIKLEVTRLAIVRSFGEGIERGVEMWQYLLYSGIAWSIMPRYFFVEGTRPE
jgi:hypothetical protein